MILKNISFFTSLCILIFGIVILGNSFSYEYYNNFGPGPGFLPRWISGGLIILSILYMIDTIKKNPVYFKEILPDKKGLWNVISVLISVVLFIIIIPYVGFVVSGTFMMFLTLRREYKWYLALGISIFSTWISFYAFNDLLMVKLPAFSWYDIKSFVGLQ
jgi:putative tricarboxylic transport membrane protein